MIQEQAGPETGLASGSEGVSASGSAGSPAGSSATVAPEVEQVLQEVVQMTGLPKEYVDSEISSLLGTPQSGVSNLTLDQLRLVMLNYLETINEEMTHQQPPPEQFS